MIKWIRSFFAPRFYHVNKRKPKPGCWVMVPAYRGFIVGKRIEDELFPELVWAQETGNSRFCILDFWAYCPWQDPRMIPTPEIPGDD